MVLLSLLRRFTHTYSVIFHLKLIKHLNSGLFINNLQSSIDIEQKIRYTIICEFMGCYEKILILFLEAICSKRLHILGKCTVSMWLIIVSRFHFLDINEKSNISISVDVFANIRCSLTVIWSAYLSKDIYKRNFGVCRM